SLSNLYSFSTRTHGNSCHCFTKSSLRCVSHFSALSNSSGAFSHAWRVPILCLSPFLAILLFNSGRDARSVAQDFISLYREFVIRKANSVPTPLGFHGLPNAISAIRQIGNLRYDLVRALLISITRPESFSRGAS